MSDQEIGTYILIVLVPMGLLALSSIVFSMLDQTGLSRGSRAR